MLSYDQALLAVSKLKKLRHLPAASGGPRQNLSPAQRCGWLSRGGPPAAPRFGLSPPSPDGVTSDQDSGVNLAQPWHDPAADNTKLQRETWNWEELAVRSKQSATPKPRASIPTTN